MIDPRDPPGAIASAVFRLALRAFPPEFRIRFGDSMLEAFDDGYLERNRPARGGRTSFVMRATLSVLWAGLRERLKPSHRMTGHIDRGEGEKMRKLFEALVQDFRFTARSLKKRPGFTFVAVATLALGVGATTTIFSVVNGVLLKPLPYPDSNELISVSSNWSGEFGPMSPPDLVDVEEQSSSVQWLVGISATNRTVTGLGQPEVLRVARLTRGLLEVFKLSPALGRDIRADEAGPDGPQVAVISHGFWRERFGGDPDVLGATFQLDRETYEVVGVAPAEFDYPANIRLWIPHRQTCGRGCHNLRSVGRLAPGATLGSAKAEVTGIALNLQEAFPDTNTDKDLQLTSLHDLLVGSVKPGLRLLLGAVLLVLLIACVNVANLLLVRASARSGELAVRTALGASHRRLIGQSLVESFSLAALGGVVGLALADGALRVLPSLAGSAIPRLDFVQIDATVVGVSFATVLLITILFGLAPALSIGRTSLRSGIQSQRDDGAPKQQRFRSWLLAGEVALSALLLIGAGLLVRTFQELYDVDVGYETESVLRFNLNLPDVEYPTLQETSLFYRTLEEDIRAIPGVASVGSTWGSFLGGPSASGSVYVEGRPDPAVEDDVEASVHSFGPGLLETMNIEVVRGRAPSVDEERGSEAVALINGVLAQRLFPDEEPIGQRLRGSVSVSMYPTPDSYRIIGVIGNLRTRSLTGDPEPEYWVPHAVFGPGGLTVMVRTAAGSPSVIPQIRELVRAKDPNLPLYRVGTVKDGMSRQVAPTRFYMVLAAAFAGLAAILAAVGLYGIVAFSVSRRTREIGLRVALGADRGGIIRLVLGQGIQPALWGLGVGLVGAYFAGGLLNAVIFGVGSRDPATFIGTGILLILVSAAATALPARRATRVDPVVALRAD